MRKTQPGIDKDSEAYQTASAVMGDGKPSAVQAPASGIHSIDITPSDNGGCTVWHMPKETGKHAMGGDYAKKQTNTFSDMVSAHEHVGKLMGVGTGASLKGGSGGLK